MCTDRSDSEMTDTVELASTTPGTAFFGYLRYFNKNAVDEYRFC